jgi:signal transduction histidine kinase
MMIDDKLISVLLIEDDSDDAELIKEFLPDERGYSFKIKWEMRLNSALNCLNTSSFDIILLDLSLPDSFGVQTVIDVHQEAPAVPLVILTGFDDETTAIEAMRQGAQDYIIKWIVDSNILVRTMRYAIERNRLLVELERKQQEQLRMAEQLRLMEKKELEGQIAEQRHVFEIKTLKVIEQKAIELERSNTELEQFAYVASHDLQEPLRSIIGYLQLLQRRYEGKLDNDADKFISRAVTAANRMSALIRDLLDYSRVQRKGKPFKNTDCSKTFNHVINNLHSVISDTQAVITHDPLPVIQADSTQIIQLLQNLISNAIKFKSSNPPTIHISAQHNPDSNEWLFSVKDNGIGIDKEYFERIFLIFQRLHTIREYDGTGIGLAVCKKIVERHGGRIWVESEPGKGSTFFFTVSEIHEKEEKDSIFS